MDRIPDAPWIRHAELYGTDDGPEILCPICGEEPETIYMDCDKNVFGCNKCIVTQDAWDWAQDELERSRPDEPIDDGW